MRKKRIVCLYTGLIIAMLMMNTAMAEKVTLTFGYEMEVPEGTKITEEKWTPEDDFVYRVNGTYDNGESEFCAIIYRQGNDDTISERACNEIINSITSFSIPLFIEDDYIGLGIGVVLSEGISDVTAVFEYTDRIFPALDEIGDDTWRVKQTTLQTDNAQLPVRSKVFGEYMHLSRLFYEEYPDAQPVSVAEGHYTINMGTTSDQSKLLEAQEGSVSVTYYTWTNEHGAEYQDAAYEYMPLPESFVGVEYLSDEEYMAKIEEAFELLAEEKAELLKSLLVEEFGVSKLEFITNENLKMDYMGLIEEIEKLRSNVPWFSAGYSELAGKIDQAINLCKFWERYQEQTPLDRPYRHYLVKGQRWLESKYRLSSLWGGYGNCAIFDGALHYVEGYVDLASLVRNENWIPQKEVAVDQTNQEDMTVQELEEMLDLESVEKPVKQLDLENIGESKQDTQIVEKRIAIVNTKSSPLTMREEPVQNGKMILEIPKGESVVIVDEGEWPLVEYEEKQGYVNGKYLEYPEIKYQKAIEDQKNNYHMRALDAFHELGDYKDAAFRAEEIKAAKLYPMRKNKKYGLMNEKGQWVHKPQWDFVGEAVYLRDNQYAYRIFKGQMDTQYANLIPGKGKWGLIDRKGREIIPCIWDSIVDIKDGYVICSNTVNYQDEYSMYYYDGESTRVIAENYSFLDSVHEGYILYEKNGSKGYLHQDGSRWAGIEYADALSFSDGLATVEIDGKCGYIDTQGDIALEPVWNSAGFFRHGLANAEKENKWGYINKQGEWVIEPQYDEAWSFDDDYPLAIVEKDGKQWLIDTNGRMVGKKWDKIYAINYDGTAIVEKNNKFGFVNTAGDVIVEAKYDSVNRGADILFCEVDSKTRYYTPEGKLQIDGSNVAKKLKKNYLYFSQYIYYDAIACYTDKEMVIIHTDGSILMRESTNPN